MAMRVSGDADLSRAVANLLYTRLDDDNDDERVSCVVFMPRWDSPSDGL